MLTDLLSLYTLLSKSQQPCIEFLCLSAHCENYYAIMFNSMVFQHSTDYTTGSNKTIGGQHGV